MLNVKCCDKCGADLDPEGDICGWCRECVRKELGLDNCNGYCADYWFT